MLFLLSPAKTLDFETTLSKHALHFEPKVPVFVDQTMKLVAHLKKMKPEELASLMSISESLAQLNAKRFKSFGAQFNAHNARPALMAFNGDVYEGLDAKSLNAKGLGFAQSHVLILSGLYGVLKPMDLMQAYRLEMGTSLVQGGFKNLYQFWGSRISEHLNEVLTSHSEPTVINLASQEYFKAVDRKALKSRVIDCVFEDEKDHKYKVISFFAKRARGLMVRFAIDRQIKTPKALQAFECEGYRFHAPSSLDDHWVFRRPQKD
jgi:cytoplasmic iron level regulating protein YaaA (DUF328/UPF0246 family)